MKRFIRNVIDRALRHPRLRWAIYRSVIDDNKFMIRVNDDHMIVCDPSEHIGRAVIEKGDWNRQITEQIIDRVSACRENQTPGAWLEIGANIGTQSVYAGLRSHYSEIVCVEPDPSNKKLLEINLRINGLQDKSRIVTAGVSDASTTMTLYRMPGNSGAASFLPAAEHQSTGLGDPLAADAPIDVPVLSGRDLLKEIDLDGKDIELIWVDVEGFELKVLSGLLPELKHSVPIFFEYSPHLHVAADREILESMLFEYYGTVEEIFPNGDARRLDLAKIQDIDYLTDILLLP